MKSGANRVEQNKIKKMAEDGTTVAEISYKLQISEDCVKNFLPEEESTDEEYEDD